MSSTPRTSTIPYTPTPPGWPSVHPRPLGPIGLHPRLDTPVLPTSPRASIFHTTAHGVYRLSTHLVPAAYPRLTPDIPLPAIPAYAGESPSERRAKMDALVNEVQDIQDTYAEGKLGGKPSEKSFWSCVNRYVRTSAQCTGGITLFLAHANGFHKETWETMVRNLLDAPAGEMVDEVWSWDAVQHGDAGIVNAENHGGIYDWLDNSRDIAHFLLHYIPEDAGDTALPMRLERLPDSVAKGREEHGYGTRKLVVIGHSFGGCTSLRAAIDFPKLFSAFVLIDPVIRRPLVNRPGDLYPLVLSTLTRRDRWASREDALRLLKKSPFFNVWHPDVLQGYVDYALVDVPDVGVTLKMSPLQEGISFANRLVSWETWELLEKLDGTIALRWVMPEKPLTSTEATYELVWRRPVNSTNIMFHFAGHLIVQEAPFELGEHAGSDLHSTAEVTLLAHDISDFLLHRHGPAKAHL